MDLVNVVDGRRLTSTVVRLNLQNSNAIFNSAGLGHMAFAFSFLSLVNFERFCLWDLKYAHSSETGYFEGSQTVFLFVMPSRLERLLTCGVLLDF